MTVDLMLTEGFEGGEFQTLEAPDDELRSWTFEKGDAMAFVSHKFHCVAPVRAGLRAVVILEFWEGPARRCAHRCLDPNGECGYTLSKNVRERMALGR